MPEAARATSADLSGSTLWNPDLAPTPPERRTWTTYNIAALWIGMSVVITTYTLASGLMEQGMTWWQAMITILLGNVIVLIPMILNAHAGTKYGISFPVLCRASFGVRGANVAAMLRAVDFQPVRSLLARPIPPLPAAPWRSPFLMSAPAGSCRLPPGLGS